MTTPLDVKRFQDIVQNKAAIVGIGETEYTKYGGIARTEFTLACEVALKACAEAGLNILDLDGFTSWSDDRNTGVDVARYLGIPEVRWNYMNWGGGGGGGSGAVYAAAVAVATGAANYVLAFRSLNQGQYGRFGLPFGGVAGKIPAMGGMNWRAPYGVMTAPDMIGAVWGSLYMERYNTPDGIWGPISVAARKHAQTNPRAVMYGRPVTLEDYIKSRWINYPMRLLDNCLETDGAIGLLITTAERAKDLKQKPAFIHSVSQGSGIWGDPAYNDGEPGANFNEVAKNLWARAGITPKDVQVVQIYENFTPMVLYSMEEHGLLPKGEGWQVIKEPGYLEAPNGKLPMNTSGGNLSEAYVHGGELISEAARQCRGESTNQVPNVKFALVASGPGVHPVSDLILKPA